MTRSTSTFEVSIGPLVDIDEMTFDLLVSVRLDVSYRRSINHIIPANIAAIVILSIGRRMTVDSDNNDAASW